MKPHKNNARVAVKAAALPQRIPAKGDKEPPKTAQHRPNLRYTAPKPRGPVPEKHHIRSGSDPHRQAGFRHAQILGTGAPALLPPGFGRGGPTRKDGRAASDVFFTPRPPAALKTQMVALVTPEGAKTMTTTTQGTTTPTPYHTTEERRAFAALEAANCAALARWYSARGNVKAARRKAVQLLAALAVLEGVQHA